MTVAFTMRDNFPDVLRDYAELEDAVATKAGVSAINKTLAQGQTRMIRAITAEFNISAREVREALVIKRAFAGQGRYLIEGWLGSPTKRGRSLNLIHFSARQTRQGVTFKIKRGGGRQLIPGAFIANKDNSAGGVVFIREGKSRLPIKAIQTIAVAQMFNTERVNAEVRAFIEANFPRIYASEMKFYVDRFNAKRAKL